LLPAHTGTGLMAAAAQTPLALQVPLASQALPSLHCAPVSGTWVHPDAPHASMVQGFLSSHFAGSFWPGAQVPVGEHFEGAVQSLPGAHATPGSTVLLHPVAPHTSAVQGSPSSH
jgi:hypothetical protein